MAMAMGEERPASPVEPDPMDDPNFDTIAFVNGLFPTEQSVQEATTMMNRVETKLRRMDARIIDTLLLQNSTAAKGHKDIDRAKKSLDELMNKITEINQKAEAAGDMSTRIYADIHALDTAKKNLASSIGIFSDWEVLSHSIEQLKVLLEKKEYAPAAKIIGAAAMLCNKFDGIAHIPQIATITQDVQLVLQQFYQRAREEMRAYLTHRAEAPVAIDVCEVVDQFGAEKRQEFINFICDLQMTEYRVLFAPNTERYGLDHADERYKWLNAHLEVNAPHLNAAIPAEWNIFEYIVEEFCCLTRLDLIAILENTRSKMDVKVLITALKKTTDFEKQLREDFCVEEQDDAEAEDDNDDDDDDGRDSRADIAPPRVKFKGVISTCFDPYLDLYMEQEDKNLGKAISDALGEESWEVEGETGSKVLSSTTDIVFYMNTVLTRCRTMSNGQPLYDLSLLFCKHMRSYCNILVGKLPSDTSKFTTKEARQICSIVNSAEYLQQKMQQLVGIFRRCIQPKWKKQVDMAPLVNEIKSNCISKGVQKLATLVRYQMDTPLQEMPKQPWDAASDSTDELTDHSVYMKQVLAILASSVPVVQASLAVELHYTLFCDILARLIATDVVKLLYKCRRINEAGAHRLLIDLATLRAALLQLPAVAAQQQLPSDTPPLTPLSPRIADDGAGSSGGATPAQSQRKPKSHYSRMVYAEIGKGEGMLKVILAPLEVMIDTFLAVNVRGTEEEFQRLLEIKGLDRAEIKLAVNQFRMRVNPPLRVSTQSTPPPALQPTPPQLPQPPQLQPPLAATAAVAAVQTPSEALAPAAEAPPQVPVMAPHAHLRSESSSQSLKKLVSATTKLGDRFRDTLRGRSSNAVAAATPSPPAAATSSPGTPQIDFASPAKQPISASFTI
eukprot:TRINITY_DN547_c0_g4_i1.p1 TRINITY_DN547_c0_g4~~TRINITY_DN547_c0_g4_i1.p1  ORF type:complete len:994 (+),score=331.14 TRINITY_DN547_c0_g4_i1:289-2982(+)